ncbi:aminotransferase class I/II-fold pyridoxal phosphate-dependent enzyme [Siminovitchia fortis]|uniref:Aminotransferase class I/II-fold pyridoxal phosphate-dependent enzyme n=1 Tax=Siminovitchia fortis TaxID=254758 RepID=A0A451GBU6_9BACI|nr:aminotransferase class I/II-fold pyridoxal phosphate-dependent enzyme [Siminovitchia fortis]RWR12548.1 aminotransferase class I/II-fold pyridoxal phosphate-dependent enzyme [Siminovitchia fortis]WHY81607.1 aminotransferase class I/II-fold pyridoxal phosphate-dependent enzyme [Siminovitchia fortis]
MSSVPLKKETLLAQVGNDRDEPNGAISTPIYLSAPYRHHEIGLLKGYDYIRTSNPTREVLENAIAKLEKGDRGFACSSGMSAVQLAFSLFKSGDHIVASRDLYGGSYRLFEWLSQQYQLEFSYWDPEENEVEGLIRKNTKGLFIETPTNPLMTETDLKLAAETAKKYGLLLIVDNTFYTPLLQRPIELGADVVIHSATKYLGGHNDLLAGLVVSANPEQSDRLFDFHNSCGAVLPPFDCWLLIRGMKTLALRMERHEKNAKEIYSFLSGHPLVDQVYYPRKGGMVSFEIAREAWVAPFLKALKLFTFAESLGGVESLITYPATQTHADVPEETRTSYGLSNRLLRVSVGIEHADDLIEDLAQAFNQLKEPAPGIKGQGGAEAEPVR